MLRNNKIGLRWVAITLLFSLIACGVKSAGEPTPQPTVEMTVIPSLTSTGSDTLITQLDQYMQDHYPVFSGTILVAEKSEDLITLSYGLADHENEVPNTPQTKYAIGSISKSFTAMAIMILEERGVLRVEDSVCEYLPDCPDAWQAVTLHHLLTHSSGIPSYTDLHVQGKIEGHPCVEYTPAEVFALFKDFPLEFPPGSRWHYNNSGYFLLGMVMEAVTGESYATFIQENILVPLEMLATGYNHAHEIVKKRASGYSLDVLELINAPCWHVSTQYAAGGLYSTAGDLYKWDQAFYSNPLVSKETLDKIFASAVATNRGSQQYGYGWFLTEASGHQIIAHGGSVSGFVSHLARYPNDQVTIIVLSNFDKLDVSSISRELAAVVFDHR